MARKTTADKDYVNLEDMVQILGRIMKRAEEDGDIHPEQGKMANDAAKNICDLIGKENERLKVAMDAEKYGFRLRGLNEIGKASLEVKPDGLPKGSEPRLENKFEPPEK